MKNNLLIDTSLKLELNKAKVIIDQFIRSCSHNLKSPLTSIEGLVMVASRCTTLEEINQCLVLIQNSTTKMKEIIENLDQYTCNLKREFAIEQIKPEILIKKVLSEYHEEIELERIVVSTEISQSSKWLCDKHVHYLILKNLVANAIHFSDSTKVKKKLMVNIDVKQDQVKLEISDNGIGILETEKERIYIPFYRSSVQSKGNGLGLFLVKGLIEKLRASISVRSGEKIGTSILLSLPNNCN